MGVTYVHINHLYCVSLRWEFIDIVWALAQAAFQSPSETYNCKSSFHENFKL